MTAVAAVSWALLALAAVLLGGCTVKTSVQLTATTPAYVTHLYVTVKEFWFTPQANATPTESEWTREVLPDPVTVDLAALNGGTVRSLGRSTLYSGGYAQMRLVLADADAALTDSASDLGLDWNNAVEYRDEDGASHVVPLELANTGVILQFPVSIRLRGDSSTASTDSTPEDSGDSATIVVDVDALRSLIVFNSGGEAAAILDPGLKAYEDSRVGTIKGNFDLSSLPTGTVGSDQGIVVSAQLVNRDGNRRSIVKSTRVGADGSFTLYPLPVDEDAGAYDIVVQGPGIQTLVVTGIAVEAGEASTLQDSAIVLSAAPGFLVNTATAVHGGTVAEFYQTLPADSRPYLIGFAAVNPFGTSFPADLSLSSAQLRHGPYNDGGAIAFTDAAAQEGNARYRLAGNARWRAISNFTTVTGDSDDPDTVQTVSLQQSRLPEGASPGTISGTVQLRTANLYDSLHVIVSRGGQIVDAVDLGPAIAGRTSVNFSVTDVPAGISSAVYDVAIRAWSSRDPAGTLVRAAFATQADLRQGNAGGLSLQL